MYKWLIKKSTVVDEQSSDVTNCTNSNKRKPSPEPIDKSKRARIFDTSWQKGRPWLIYEETEECKKMFCLWCRSWQYGNRKAHKCSFISGTSNWKLSAVKEHASSDIHCQAAAINQAKCESKLKESVASKALKSLNKETVDHLQILFKTANALARQGRPFTDFPCQLQLLESAGVQVGSRYRSDKSAAEFISAIAAGLRETHNSNLSAAPFLSVISDGATDSSVTEEKIVYLRYCNKGCINVSYVGVAGVSKADAEGITGAIESCITNYAKLDLPIFYRKLVALGSDGASVMTGKKSGVVARLRDNQPCLQGIHCCAHRLELAYKDTIRKQPLFEKIDTLLLNIYLFYHNSPLNRANLKETYKALDKPCLLPSRVGGTRWIPHTLQALSTLIKGYSVFTTHLHQLSINGKGDAQAKAKGMLLVLVDPDILKFCHFLWDILLVLSRVSLKIQERNVTVAQVFTEIDFAKDILEKFKLTDGDKLSRVIQLMDGDRFEGQIMKKSLSRGANRNEIFHKARHDVMEKLLFCLNTRFQDSDTTVMKSTRIADLSVWPEEDALLGQYGDDEIKTITGHYLPILQYAGIDVDNMFVEWSSLKRKLITAQFINSGVTWETINNRFGPDHGNILALFDLILSLPASSAEGERGFSVMKQIKSDWRSNLTSTTLSDLMTISIHGEDITAFNANPGINIWLQDANRRTGLHSYQRLSNDHKVNIETEEHYSRLTLQIDSE